MKQSIIISGHIDDDHHLQLNEPLPEFLSGKVRVILVPENDTEISGQEWLQAIAKNPVFEFLDHPDEDIYTIDDGKRFEKV